MLFRSEEKRKILLTRSEELSDIMEQIPHWLIRSGVLMLMFVLLLIFGGSYFFPHLEKITLPAKLIPLDPPIPLTVSAGGFIDKVCVIDRSQVDAGDYIVYLRGTENPQEVFAFEHLLDSLKDVNRYRLPEVPENAMKISGQFHLDYSELLNELRSLSLRAENSLYSARIELFNERIARTQELLDDTKKQYSLRQEEMLLISGKTERDSTLHSWKMLSLEELEVSRRQYLSSRSVFYDYTDRLRSLELNLIQLVQEKRELELSATEELNSSMLKLDALMERIKARLDIWKMDYLITSPASGRVYFNEELTRHMRLASGTVIGLVVPPEVSSLKCSATAMGDEVVLIREGMMVRVRLPGYESDRGNYIEGVVSSVSNAGIGGIFKISIELKEGFADLNERFGVFYGLEGTAEVIVKRGRLFNKLLEPDKGIKK